MNFCQILNDALLQTHTQLWQSKCLDSDLEWYMNYVMKIPNSTAISKYISNASNDSYEKLSNVFGVQHSHKRSVE